VHGLLSSHATPVIGVTVQPLPLQLLVLHMSPVQLNGIPTHCPELLHLSPDVHALPSSQGAPVFGVVMQIIIWPLQERLLH
jgi:hypothetical protein